VVVLFGWLSLFAMQRGRFADRRFAGLRSLAPHAVWVIPVVLILCAFVYAGHPAVRAAGASSLSPTKTSELTLERSPARTRRGGLDAFLDEPAAGDCVGLDCPAGIFAPPTQLGQPVGY